MSVDQHYLFAQGVLGHIQVKNRVVLAPMTRISATPDGLATEDMARYYSNFARCGFGLLITEGTYIDQRYSQGYLNQPGITSAAQVCAWHRATKAVHETGAAFVMQLMHAGAQTQGNPYVGGKTIAPSAVAPKGEQLGIYGGEGSYPTPTAMGVEDIRQVVQAFADSAVRAREAGFDGVEIHGANGYLLDEFLTDYMNQRSDSYGGCVENRVRLLVEVITAVRRAAGKDFTVGIRISQGKVGDYAHKWAGGEADAAVIFAALANAGVDFIHTSEHEAAAPAFGTGPTLAALAKRYGKVAVIANGGLNEPAKAEKLLTASGADFVALGKPALANRDWPRRARQGLPMAAFDFGLLLPRANLKPVEL